MSSTSEILGIRNTGNKKIPMLQLEKPKPSRVLQDPEQGMLYVIIGNNIYPLVQDGKHVKNFLKYKPDSGSDLEEESYWRQKYVEEKKKTDDFKKLLKDNQESTRPGINKAASPILPSPRTPNTRCQQMPVQNYGNNGKEVVVEAEVEKKVDTKDDKMVLKIASKNGLEYCLEGGWNQISNAMPQVVRMLQSETTSANNVKVKEPPEEVQMEPPIRDEVDQQPSKADKAIEDISGMLTPIKSPKVVDPEIRAKVSKIESEIFKEIEEQEKAEQITPKEHETTNITTRMPTRRRNDSSSLSTASTQSAVNRARVTKTSSTDSKQDDSKPTKRKRVSKQDLDVPKDKLEPIKSDTEKPVIRARNKKSEQQAEVTKQKAEVTEQKAEVPAQKADVTKQKEPIQTDTTKVVEEQSDKMDEKRESRRQSIRTLKKVISESKLDVSEKSPVRSRSRSSIRTSVTKTPKKYETDSSTSQTEETKLKPKKSSSKETTDLIGFDDDGARFMFPPTTRRNKSPKGKNNRSLDIIHPQEKNTENSIDSTQGYQDSDASPMKICLPKRKRKISLTTQRKHKNRRAARKNSYPTLLQELVSDSSNSSYFVPIRKSQSTLNSDVYKTDSYELLVPKAKLSFNTLDPIDEACPQVDTNKRHFNSISKNSDKSSDSSHIIGIGSSSNISLPLSPELSVVENLSISREVINDVNHPTVNEMLSNVSNNAMDFSEYMISKLDVPVPLMNQQCELQNKRKVITKNNATKSTPYSDPQLNPVCEVRIENLTLSESLDRRLRELLLESSKKMTKTANIENAMEVDETNIATGRKTRSCNRKGDTMEVDKTKIAATTKTRAKKRSSTPRKKKTARTTKVPKHPVIEEEHTASCSQAGRKSCPPVITFLSIDENANNSADVTLNKVQVKTRKKKDVIKVKIQKPRQKSLSTEQLREKSVENASVTTYTDSGINDTISAVFLKDSNDSVDLIHNHSETCLMANECIGDSLIFVENSNSVISVNSSVDSELQRFLENASDKLFSNVKDIAASSEPRTSDKVFESPETVYHTPIATNSSLITEDLSDELPPQPTKWYLLGEDDTNTQPASDTVRFGSNLKHLFPVACAVPNLSTISEASKENEDSRKPYPDVGGDTRNYDTQNLFGVEFGNYF